MTQPPPTPAPTPATPGLLSQANQILHQHRKGLLAGIAAVVIIVQQGIDWTSLVAALGALGVDIVPNRPANG